LPFPTAAVPSPLRFLLLLSVALCGGVRPAAAQERTLTTAREVRALTPAEAEQGRPARLRGVVVFVESISAIFLQDETSTTFFRVRTPPHPQVGDEIELTSTTRMGLYLPGLGDSTYRVIGRRALPPGIPVQYDDLHFGRFHYQRVAIEGVVRSIQPLPAARADGPPRSLLRLALGSQLVDVRLEVPAYERPLIDHRVRVTGLAAGLINTRNRQLVRPYLRVNGWDDVEVLAPGTPADELPQISADELLAFHVDGLGERRVKINGTVSALLGDTQAFLQQGARAFDVRFPRATALQPGDAVTVVGFPSMERFSASIVDAELVTRVAGPAPAAIEVESVEELYGRPGEQFPGRLDGHLVRLTATVRDSFRSDEGITLLVQDGQRTLQARVPEGIPLPDAGSVVRLTGICQVETTAFGSGFLGRPGLVSLRLASAAGLEVLRTPPWWTPRRLTAILAALAGLTLLAGLWIAVLRRQVSRQTAALAARIQSEAALAERQRIAREFHDSLEQELAGVSLRLDALATRPLDDKGRSLIGATRNLVSRIQSETRELIADLRDAAESAGDLSAALAAVAARQSADSGLEVRFESACAPPALAPAIVHDLRMIARESVTNASKHGRASHVRIGLEHDGRTLQLRIADNGCGFDPAAATEARRGHFGCAGMRERARKIGAGITWSSTLQRGTTVEVTLPWPTPSPASTSPASAAAAPSAVDDRLSSPTS
jgi:signal transduction histidine kinase